MFDPRSSLLLAWNPVFHVTHALLKLLHGCMFLDAFTIARAAACIAGSSDVCQVLLRILEPRAGRVTASEDCFEYRVRLAWTDKLQ